LKALAPVLVVAQVELFPVVLLVVSQVIPVMQAMPL
jgi:hypothetical protein